MAGITAQGATFTFENVRGTVLSLRVETPSAEMVDMTGAIGTAVDAANVQVMVPTGAFTGGFITLDYLVSSTAASGFSVGVPSADLGKVGQIVFASPSFSVIRRGILESATVEARTGELVQGTMRFRLTDYTGT